MKEREMLTALYSMTDGSVFRTFSCFSSKSMIRRE